MSNLTKFADLGDKTAYEELLERIEQLEIMHQESPKAGYGPCLEFYKRIAACMERREEKAFQDGWSMAYRNVGWGHTRFTQHEANVGYNLWLGLDAHGNEIK
jgi:hypothetical protein